MREGQADRGEGYGGDRTEIYAANPRIGGRSSDVAGQNESTGMKFGISVRGLSATERTAASLSGKTEY